MLKAAVCFARLWALVGVAVGVLLLLSVPNSAFASGSIGMEIPNVSNVQFLLFGSTVSGRSLLLAALLAPALGLLFGAVEFFRIKRLPAHQSMLEVSQLIWETCKTYLLQQGKFLVVLQTILAVCIFYYFYFLQQRDLLTVFTILSWSLIGLLGSYLVAWFGIRINTHANSRTAHASLQGKPYPVVRIPLQAGMSVGVVLISVELLLLISVILFVSPSAAGACFIGFAIGESLSASALRICGGIFTKIADIGADLMKIVFQIDEDDARNPGVIADCAGDNAGDSVGPTADGFETYGVTAVALITFVSLAVGVTGLGTANQAVLPFGEALRGSLIVWLFLLCIAMILTSLISYWGTSTWTEAAYGRSKNMFNFEAPLSALVWVTGGVSLLMTYAVSFLILGSGIPLGLDRQLGPNLWWVLASIVGCGTVAAALIPELTKAFTSTNSRHVREIVNAAREGGASLAIISGLVAGNFSAFWKGMVFVGLMFVAYAIADAHLSAFMSYPAVFAFGLVAFGFLSLGPVTIAVDSFGPVSDNAQSVFELSQIESIKGIDGELTREFGFKPDFENSKMYLEANDAAGNTFKATSKPVLIGTAVIGSTTMIFSIILLLNLKLDLMDARVLLGLISGGAVVYWFCGASMQAVGTGAYRAVEFIKSTINLDTHQKASIEDSKQVVRICTQFAQTGMVNIFGVLFSFTIAFACFDATFFASYLISIATFGLFQAIFMANAGGAWDNAKKLVEVELRAKGTPLHAAVVVGDTVGDPFKDTSSVALNPVIKFTTLFGLLAAEIAAFGGELVTPVGIVFFLVGLAFVHRSFYGMRIVSGVR